MKDTHAFDSKALIETNAGGKDGLLRFYLPSRIMPHMESQRVWRRFGAARERPLTNTRLNKAVEIENNSADNGAHSVWYRPATRQQNPNSSAAVKKKTIKKPLLSINAI